MAQQLGTGGKIEAMSDVTYDVVTELSNSGKAVDTLDTYIEDAKKANDTDALKAFEQIRQDEIRHADMLRNLICSQVNQGKL